MSLQYSVETRGAYRLVRADGEPTLGEFLDFIRELAQATRSWPERRALFDLRSIRTLKTFTEHYSVGEEVARSFGHFDRIASVVAADRITRASEKMARRGGVNLTVFTSEGEAIAWLVDAADRQ